MSDLCVCGHSRDEHTYAVPFALQGICVHRTRADRVCECICFRPPCLDCGDPIPDHPGQSVCDGCAAERAEALR